jgi:hypothetical protein
VVVALEVPVAAGVAGATGAGAPLTAALMLNATPDPPFVAAVLLDSVTSLRSGISISRESSRATLSCENARPEMDSPCPGAAVVVAVPLGAAGAVMVRVEIVTSSGMTSENSRRIRSQAIRVDIASAIAASRGCSSLVTAGMGMIGFVCFGVLALTVSRLCSELDLRGGQLLLLRARLRVRRQEAGGQGDEHDHAERRADDDRRILVADALRLGGVAREKVDGAH